jgi:predicted carbohydrate-binding protein with CBM5 and CBM33 domain
MLYKNKNSALLYCMALSMSGILNAPAFAHGYIETSRSKQCADGTNTNCGGVQYEPQSVEGSDRFPETGPADGIIAAAGSASWTPLNEQSPTRWSKVSMQPGSNTFNWVFTANHRSRDWRYFITKPDWNPSQPLARSSFDLTPFCVYDGNNTQPLFNLSHNCNVPERSGYQIILGVWDVADTDASFYSVVDVQFSGDQISNPLRDIGDISPSQQLSVNDTVRIRPFDANGELSSQVVEYVIASAADGDINTWPKDTADFLNSQSSDMSAGVLNQQGQVVTAVGKNDIFVASNSNIVRAEIEIKPADTGGGVPEFSVTLPQNEFPDNAPMELAFSVLTTESLEVTAQLYFAGVSIDLQQQTVSTSQNFSLSVNSPSIGSYDLIIVARNISTQATAQQTFSITVTDSNAGGGEPTYPENRGQYQLGALVKGTDGKLYSCKIPGWCNSPSDAYYAPGTGWAWNLAWTLQ